MINAYRDTLAYREKYPDDNGWASKYSYFDEVYKRSDLREWFQRKGNRKHLMDWIYRERIRTGFDIRKLPLILQNKRAIEVLNRYNAERAYAYLAKKDPRLVDGFYRKMSDVIRSMQEMPAGQLATVAGDSNRVHLIRSLHENSLRVLEKIERLRNLRRKNLHRNTSSRG